MKEVGLSLNFPSWAIKMANNIFSHTRIMVNPVGRIRKYLCHWSCIPRFLPPRLVHWCSLWSPGIVLLGKATSRSCQSARCETIKKLKRSGECLPGESLCRGKQSSASSSPALPGASLPTWGYRHLIFKKLNGSFVIQIPNCCHLCKSGILAWFCFVSFSVCIGLAFSYFVSCVSICFWEESFA